MMEEALQTKNDAARYHTLYLDVGCGQADYLEL